MKKVWIPIRLRYFIFEEFDSKKQFMSSHLHIMHRKDCAYLACCLRGGLRAQDSAPGPGPNPEYPPHSYFCYYLFRISSGQSENKKWLRYQPKPNSFIIILPLFIFQWHYVNISNTGHLISTTTHDIISGPSNQNTRLN